MTDTHAATELKLYIDNDAQLHKAQHVPILKNLSIKKVRSQYKHDLAVKLFGYLVESGAKKYAKEFGSPDQPWHKMFDVPTRKRVAEELTRDFEGEFELGNYDRLLPKKYQAEMVTGTKKMPGRGHATKKSSSSRGVKWKVPEGIKIAWSVPNNAWFVLWPASAPLKNQQVLKIANTEDLNAWLRERYGDAYGRIGASRAHSTVSSASARKKSPSQLDREIAKAVPSWRKGR
jgi:hypothetical protein